MKQNNELGSAFKDCVTLKAIDLPIPNFKPLPMYDGFVKATYLLPIIGLPRLKRGKPRKTTYRTTKRDSAKRNGRYEKKV